MFRCIAIYGLGLLGGSICRALRQSSSKMEITAFARTTAKLAGALDEYLVDRVVPMEEADLDGMDLVVIATPVSSAIGILRKVLDSKGLGSNALVIDVGSVKSQITSAASAHPRGKHFVGCHPMAGSEKTGYEHSWAELYRGASIIITPHEANSEEEIAMARGFWEMLGGRVTVVDPALHDRLVAYTSHMPHVVAGALVEAVAGHACKSGGIDLSAFIGGGFRDSTRIAGGSPDMWLDIVRMNSEKIVAALDDVIDCLRNMRGIIGSGDETAMRSFLENARSLREGMRLR